MCDNIMISIEPFSILNRLVWKYTYIHTVYKPNVLIIIFQ